MDALDINEQLNLLRQVVLPSQADVVLADSDLLQVLDCSPAAHERLGNSREEYLAPGPLGLQADPEHDAAWLRRHVTLLHRVGKHSFHTRYRNRDGGCHDLEVHLQLMACRSRQLALVSHRKARRPASRAGGRAATGTAGVEQRFHLAFQPQVDQPGARVWA